MGDAFGEARGVITGRPRGAVLGRCRGHWRIDGSDSATDETVADGGRHGYSKTQPMATGGEDPEDSYTNVVLDADFVKGARRRELSARERRESAARARAEQDRLASVKRTDRRKQRINHRAIRAIRGGRLRPAMTLLVVGALLSYAVFWGRGRGQIVWASGLPVTQVVAANDERPTPRPSQSPAPLRLPAAKPVPGGKYGFLHMQPGSSVPVTYDPCRPIAVAVNPRTAPAAGERLVADALDEVGKQAGLEFRHEGIVNEAPVHPRSPFQSKTYGDRWAPLLIAWSDAVETPRLGERIAGLGGSTAVAVSATESVYVTGTVTLDGPQFAELLDRDGGYESARAVLLHELGHVIGLSHVDDAQQLMHDENSAGLTSFGAGDLSGIAALGAAARCHATL